jgi:hypothetical protein
MNALIAMAKRPSIVLDATDQESGLWDFILATAKNAQERERALVLSAAGQTLFQHRHNQTDHSRPAWHTRREPALSPS